MLKGHHTGYIDWAEALRPVYLIGQRQTRTFLALRDRGP